MDYLMYLEQREHEKSPDGFPYAFSLPFLTPFDVVSLLVHMRSEKFEAVDAAWTRDLMIVTELGEDGVQIALLLWWKRLESLDCLGPVCIFMNVPIRSNHGVMGR